MIVLNLDRSLLSVNSFLNKGNNWVHFEKDYIELGRSEGPRIRLPSLSLQSNIFVVASGNKQKREEYPNSEKK